VAPDVAQERANAYEQEKGRRVATHEDIENVLNEVHAVTEKTETIKAQISGDLWLLQTVWNQKRDVYRNVLKCSHRFKDKLVGLRSAHLVLSEDQEKGLPETHLQMMETEVKRWASEYVEAQRVYIDALEEAAMFLDGPVTQFLSDFVAQKELGNVMKGTSDPDKSLALIFELGTWINKLIDFAKRDLGVRASQ